MPIDDPLGIEGGGAAVANRPDPLGIERRAPAADPYSLNPPVMAGGFDFGGGGGSAQAWSAPSAPDDHAAATNAMFSDVDALIKQAEDHKGARLDANEISQLATFYHQRQASQLAYNQQRLANEQAAAAANPGFHPLDALAHGYYGNAASLYGAFDPQAGAEAQRQISEEYPIQPTAGNLALEAIGGALPDVPALALGPAAPAYFVAKGAISGVGGAREQAAELRDQGQYVSPGSEAIAAIGSGALSGAAGLVPGRIAGRLGEEGGSVIGRMARGVGETAITNRTVAAAENALARATIDPNRQPENLLAGLPGDIAQAIMFAGAGELPRPHIHPNAPQEAPRATEPPVEAQQSVPAPPAPELRPTLSGAPAGPTAVETGLGDRYTPQELHQLLTDMGHSPASAADLVGKLQENQNAPLKGQQSVRDETEFRGTVENRPPESPDHRDRIEDRGQEPQPAQAEQVGGGEAYTVINRGNGYDLGAAQPLLDDGITGAGQLPPGDHTIQGKTKTWDIDVGRDDAGRPMIAGFREAQPPAAPAQEGGTRGIQQEEAQQQATPEVLKAPEPSPASPEQPAAALYSENSAEKASRILDPRSRLGVNEDVWASNSPDLAAGQGENVGVKIEFDPSKVQTTPRTEKPSAAFAEQQGIQEVNVIGQSHELAPAVRSVTVDPTTAKGPFLGRLKMILKRDGWTGAKNEDGTTTYTKESPAQVAPESPQKRAESAPGAQPIYRVMGPEGAFFVSSRVKGGKWQTATKYGETFKTIEEGKAWIAEKTKTADPFAGEKFRLVNRESGSGDQTPPREAAPTEPTAVAEPFGIGPSTPSAEDPAFKYGVNESTSSIKNAAVDQDRAARELPAAEKVAKRDFGTVWDEAKQEVERHPGAQEDLVNELRAKPRALTDREDAMLLHKQIDLQNEYAGEAKALEEAQAANDMEGVAEHRARVAGLSDKLLDIYNIGKKVGTETGRGLNARKLMAQEDFTLAAMETRKRAANDGKPLTPEQQRELKAQHEQITSAQARLDKYLGQGDTQKQKALEKQIAFLEEKIKAGDTSSQNRGRPTVDSKVVAQLKEKLTQLKDQLAALRGDQPALEAFKKRTASKTEELKGKIAAEDFTKTPRRELKLDPQANALKAQLERYKQTFETGVLRDRLKARTPLEKVQDTFVKWRRAFVLSSPVTLAKLTSAAVERMAFTPGEELLGAGIGKLIPGVASRAPREGGLNTRAEAKAITDGFVKGARDAWQTLKTGKSDLDVLYGKHEPMPRTAIDFIGSIHGALKAQAKRNEFARSFQKRTEAAIASGLDPTDPIVQQRIALDSYKDANRSIFMQDNRVVAAYKRAVAALEQPDTSGKVPLAGKAAATVAKALLPIVKVPTNIVAETMQYALGTVTGGARVARAYKRGIESLQPEEAELIMRSFKKGSLGAGVLLLGFFSPQNVGGYYQAGQKRDKKDVAVGGVRVFGMDVPRYLVHNPLLEMLQIGATARRVADSKLRKHDRETQGVGAGAVAAALGLTEEVPFARETIETAKVFDPHERPQFTANLAKSLVVPSGVDWVARKLDTDSSGRPIKREPKGILQGIESSIPGLRKLVPKAKK